MPRPRRSTTTPEPSPLPLTIADRIVGIEQINPNHLEPHPHNPRSHSAEQTALVEQSLAALGIVNALIARKLGRNRYQLLNGHLRAAMAVANQHRTVPVVIVNVTDAEADAIVLTFDALGQMATTNTATAGTLIDRLRHRTDALNLLNIIGQRCDLSPLVPIPPPDRTYDPATDGFMVKVEDVHPSHADAVQTIITAVLTGRPYRVERHDS